MAIRHKISTALLLASMLLLGGCGVYQKYGYGLVADSRRSVELQTPVELPANAPTISQRYNPTIGPANIDHRGFDILVPARTPILAATEGVVSRVSLSLLYGKQVMLDHGPGAAGFRLQTRYFHMTERLVREGQVVKRGELLGFSGMTGLGGLYPHLHFEVHRLSDGDPPISLGYQDPQRFWIDGVGKVSCYDRSREYPATPVALTYPVPCQGQAWQ